MKSLWPHQAAQEMQHLLEYALRHRNSAKETGMSVQHYPIRHTGIGKVLSFTQALRLKEGGGLQ